MLVFLVDSYALFFKSHKKERLTFINRSFLVGIKHKVLFYSFVSLSGKPVQVVQDSFH